MRPTHLYYTLIGLLFSSLLLASPRLTVVVVADGLNTNNLRELNPYWRQGGLRTIAEEGLQSTFTFSQWIYGGAETVATLMTGVTPSESGYTADQFFSRSDRKIYPLLTDKQEQGIGCDATLSPRALLSPTLADQLRLYFGDKAKIYAIGLDPYATILMAGHNANACCWLDPQKHWATTSYYKEGLPAAADQMNISGELDLLWQKEWVPRMDISSYMHPSESEQKKPFAYTAASQVLQCPMSNTAVINLALALQDKEQLGKDAIPDLLLLHLTTRTPKATSDQIDSAEQEDMYLYLNQDIGYLMEQLSKRIGEDQYQIFMVGKPLLGISQQRLMQANLPTHTFNIDQAAALTSAYLMAIYGNKRWIDGGFGQSIFLNKSLIEHEHLSLIEVQRKVADFLLEFEGVQMAYTHNEAFLNPQLAPSINKRFAGDVVFTLQHGWQLTYNTQYGTDHILDDHTALPLLYWRKTPTYRPLPTQSIDICDYILQTILP